MFVIIYTTPEHYLTYLDTLGSHPGLETIKELLNRLDNPHKALQCIHIAGTNGKGSVAAYLTSVLMESNYQVGTFTSPEITDIRETICINRLPIDLLDFNSYLKCISIHCENMVHDAFRHPTRFEVLTALSFLYFKEKNCDIILLEAGMGGRQDATNVLSHNLCSVITALSLDHTQFLGNTLEAIAWEKSGIIKPQSPVILYPSEDSVRKIFEKECAQNDTSLSVADFSLLKKVSHTLKGQVFSYKHFESIAITLLGEHQIKNAALALEVLEVLKKQYINITNQAVYNGFAKAVWPGRFEKIYETPLFFIDGAHNVQGAEALSHTISTYCQNKKIIFIMGLLKDKDYQTISKLTVPLASHIFTVEPSSTRALASNLLAEEVRPYCANVTACSSVKEAVQSALAAAAPSDVIIAFGSLYFIGQIPSILKSL